MSNRLARYLDGGPRRGRSPDHTAPREMADTLALLLRRVLVYVDPQTDLSSPQRHECRVTLNSYEKVIDAQTSATKVKRTNKAAKRISFFGETKLNTADGTFTESRPTVCVDQNMSDNDENESAGCTALLFKELPYMKTASSPTCTPRRASRDGTDNSGRSTTARRVLRDDTDELEKSTSGRHYRRSSVSSSSDSDSKHPRLSSDGRQSRRRRRSGSSRPGSSDRRRRQAARRSASFSGSRSGSSSYIRCDKFDGKTCVHTYLAKFESCAE